MNDELRIKLSVPWWIFGSSFLCGYYSMSNEQLMPDARCRIPEKLVIRELAAIHDRTRMILMIQINHGYLSPGFHFIRGLRNTTDNESRRNDRFRTQLCITEQIVHFSVLESSWLFRLSHQATKKETQRFLSVVLLGFSVFSVVKLKT
jgi:hypothetical protein